MRLKESLWASRALILRTTDGGGGWQSVTSGVEDTLRSVSFNGVNGICGGDSQDILYSTDAGASWQISQSGFLGGGFPGAQMLSATVGFVAGQNSIFQSLLGASTDGGATWAFQPFYFDQNEGGGTDLFFFDQNRALFQEAYSMDAALSPKRLTLGRVGQRYFSIRRYKALIFHRRPADLRRARVAGFRIAQMMELPGATNLVGPPTI